MMNHFVSFSKKHPMITCLIILVCSSGILFLGSLAVKGLSVLLKSAGIAYDFYLLQLMVEVIGSIWVLLLFHVFHFTKIYQGNEFFRGLSVGAFLFYICIANLVLVISKYHSESIQPVGKVLVFAITMFSVGFMEESLNRGMIAKLLLKHYHNSAKEVWFSIFVSGILFGLFHLSNAVGGVIRLSSVLVQMALAASIGIYLAAVYFRCNNLWVVIFLHGFNDFCGMFASGIFGKGDVANLINEYSVKSLVSMIPYLVVTAILLRPKKMQEIIEREMKEKEE